MQCVVFEDSSLGWIHIHCASGVDKSSLIRVDRQIGYDENFIQSHEISRNSGVLNAPRRCFLYLGVYHVRCF